MRIATAFDAADRPNKFLLLDDEGTFLHSPAPNPDGALNAADKRCGITTTPRRAVKKTVQNGEMDLDPTVPPAGVRSLAQCGQRVRHWAARGSEIMT
jgi:hypothetical protein